MVQQLRYKLSMKNFEELLTKTFIDSPPPTRVTHIKKGIQPLTNSNQISNEKSPGLMGTAGH